MADVRRHPLEHELQPGATSRRSSDWWGMIGMVLISLTAFVTLIVSYFYLRYFTAVWPPEGIPDPPLRLPLIQTGLIVLSIAPMVLSHLSVWRERNRLVIGGLSGTIVLAIAFLVLKIVELADYEFTWQDQAYGSIFWLTQVLHALYVIGGIIYLLILTAVIATDPPRLHRYTGVQASAVFWYFTAGIWLPLFVTLYLVPRF